MSVKRRYTADALQADLTNHHHRLRGVTEEEVERRMRKRYPEAWRKGLSPRSGPVG